MLAIVSGHFEIGCYLNTLSLIEFARRQFLMMRISGTKLLKISLIITGELLQSI